MKFSGNIIRSGGNSDYYAVTSHPKFVSGYMLCHRDEMCRNIKSYPETVVAWGYEGDGPSQLAVMLVANAIYSYDPEFKNLISLAKDFSPYVNQQVIGYHKDFMREIVANWGDTWEIDTKEIWEWIKKQQQKESNEQTEPASTTHP